MCTNLLANKIKMKRNVYQLSRNNMESKSQTIIQENKIFELVEAREDKS